MEGRETLLMRHGVFASDFMARLPDFVLHVEFSEDRLDLRFPIQGMRLLMDVNS